MGDRAGGYTVLVVDDSAAVQRQAAAILGTAGFRVVASGDGYQALAAIVEQRPDVVLADTAMPRLDGYQLCALLRHNPELMHTPVLLLDPSPDLVVRARAGNAGGSGCLRKPFTAEHLLAGVRDHLPHAA